nr:hypothetical protein [Tanacetum cinerariifolium]
MSSVKAEIIDTLVGQPIRFAATAALPQLVISNWLKFDDLLGNLVEMSIYGSSLLILSAYASSMPPVLSLPLYMACDDSDGCVTTMIGSSLYLISDPKDLILVDEFEAVRAAPEIEKSKEAVKQRDLTKRKQNTQKNKAGLIHKQAEEKRAMVVAKKSEDNLKADARLAPDSRGVLYILSDVY